MAGELNADLVMQNYQAFPALGREVLVEDISLTLGSASAICASGLAKLGNQVTFRGKVGCDSWGELCIDWLTRAGVDCSLVVRDAALKTGLTVSVTSAKDRALITYLGAIVALGEEDIRDADLQGCRHLHVSSFFFQQALRPRLKRLFERAHALGLSTSLDTGFDPAEQWDGNLMDVLTEVDVFFPNEVELAAITGKSDPAEALGALERGPRLTIAKLGALGAMTISGGAVVCVPAFPVKPIDTTGAGDSFNAGFLHEWLRAADVTEAMRFAAACGALSTLGLGGTASQPSEREAREFMEAHQVKAGGAV